MKGLSVLLLCSLLASPAFSAAAGAAPPAEAAAESWPTAHSLSASLQRHAQQYPELQLQQLGLSRQQQPLWLASLGAASPERQVLLVCGQHGDEPDSVQACLYLLRDLLQLARSDAAWQQRFQQHRLRLVPALNPDGLSVKRRTNAAGVNLNANWAHGRVVPLPAAVRRQLRDNRSSAYQGAMAFSEPETRALRDWLLQEPPDLVIDYHTGVAGFSQGMVLYPFTAQAHDTLSEAQARRLKPLARQQARLLSQPDSPREGFRAFQTHEVVGYLQEAMARAIPPEHLPAALAQLPQNMQAPGALIDWCFGHLNIPAIAYEVYWDQENFSPERLPVFQGFYKELQPGLLRALAAALDGQPSVLDDLDALE